ncbi:MAG: PAS domain-containing protein, partial [Dehalococcoidales bacterium]|nr:PAS domain-containing protein [Dehalococcoidales bacterium]
MEIKIRNLYENEMEIKLQDILDAIPFYVLLVDEDHYIIEANKAVKTNLGIERDEIIGKYCPLVIHGIQEPYEGCPLEEAVERNTAIEKELYDKKTGRWV